MGWNRNYHPFSYPCTPAVKQTYHNIELEQKHVSFIKLAWRGSCEGGGDIGMRGVGLCEREAVTGSLFCCRRASPQTSPPSGVVGLLQAVDTLSVLSPSIYLTQPRSNYPPPPPHLSTLLSVAFFWQLHVSLGIRDIKDRTIDYNPIFPPKNYSSAFYWC